MKARHASKSKKAKEGDDPSNSKTEKGDMVGVPIGEKVDVEEVPGTAEAGEQRLLRVEGGGWAPGNCHDGVEESEEKAEKVQESTLWRKCFTERCGWGCGMAGQHF